MSYVSVLSRRWYAVATLLGGLSDVDDRSGRAKVCTKVCMIDKTSQCHTPLEIVRMSGAQRKRPLRGRSFDLDVKPDMRRSPSSPAKTCTSFRSISKKRPRKKKKVCATHKITNFLGLTAKNGSSVNATTNKATAARLRPPKTSSRSHRLTVQLALASYRIVSRISGVWCVVRSG